jgi:hypothetical protein
VCTRGGLTIGELLANTGVFDSFHSGIQRTLQQFAVGIDFSETLGTQAIIKQALDPLLASQQEISRTLAAVSRTHVVPPMVDHSKILQVQNAALTAIPTLPSGVMDAVREFESLHAEIEKRPCFRRTRHGGSCWPVIDTSR